MRIKSSISILPLSVTGICLWTYGLPKPFTPWLKRLSCRRNFMWMASNLSFVSFVTEKNSQPALSLSPFKTLWSIPSFWLLFVPSDSMIPLGAKLRWRPLSNYMASTGSSQFWLKENLKNLSLKPSYQMAQLGHLVRKSPRISWLLNCVVHKLKVQIFLVLPV